MLYTCKTLNRVNLLSANAQFNKFNDSLKLYRQIIGHYLMLKDY